MLNEVKSAFGGDPQDEPQPEEQKINYRQRGLALVWAVLIIVLVVLAIGGGIWAYYKYKILPEMQTKSNNNATKNTTNKATDETASWKTYTNNDVGYSLKYPADWTVKETNTISEITSGPIKYINISAPDKKYSLWFGIKKKVDTFAITDRTGVGAGDVQKVGSITVLGTSVDAVKLVFQGKIHEYFYPGPGGTATSADSLWTFSASFSPDYDVLGDQEVDMTGTPYEKTAEKILETVKIIK